MCSDTSCAWRKTNRKAKPENWWEILTWFFNRNDKQQKLMICYTSSTCTSYHIQIDWFWFQIQLLQQLLMIYVDGIENRIWNCVYSPLVLLTEIQLYYCGRHPTWIAVAVLTVLELLITPVSGKDTWHENKCFLNY